MVLTSSTFEKLHLQSQKCFLLSRLLCQSVGYGGLMASSTLMALQQHSLLQFSSYYLQIHGLQGTCQSQQFSSLRT